MKRSVITVCKLRRKDSTRLAFRSVEEERVERLAPFNPLMSAKKSGRETPRYSYSYLSHQFSKRFDRLRDKDVTFSQRDRSSHKNGSCLRTK